MAAFADRTDASCEASRTRTAGWLVTAEHSAFGRRWRRRPTELEAIRDERFVRTAGVPPHVRLRLVLYVDHGVDPGGFLKSVICNDFKAASQHAAPLSSQAMFAIVSWFLNTAPAACWGSHENMAAWVAGCRANPQDPFPEALEAYKINYSD